MAEAKIQYATLPYGLTQSAGLRQNPYADIAAVAAASMPPEEASTARVPSASVAYSPSQKKFFVNGFVFDDGDDTAAVESLKVFDPSKPVALPSGDWQPLSNQGYAAYVEGITNPTLGKLAKKNFGIGVDNLQSLVGAGLKFAGAEETGQRIIDQQERDLAKTLPYQRLATEIGDSPNRGVLDWFVANLAQQGPNIVESAVTAVLGAAAGGAAGAASGPGAAVSAAGGAIAGLVGKATFKAGLLKAAKKYAAGQALEAGEKKLLMEAAGITAAARAATEGTLLKAGSEAAFKQAGKIGGAGIATLASNQALGIADIYSETEDRGYAALGSIPYSLLESSTEFLLAGRLFGDLVSSGKPLRDMGFSRKALELLRRGAVGGTVGGALEGSVEAGQEALLLAAHPSVDWNSPESVSRLLNSFAAGAGIGGPIGTMANLRGRSTPANLLTPTQDAEPYANETPPLPALPAPNGGTPLLALPAPEGFMQQPSPAELSSAGTTIPSATLGSVAPAPAAEQLQPTLSNAPLNASEQIAGTLAPAAPPVRTGNLPGDTTIGGPSAILRRRQPVPITVDTTSDLSAVPPTPEIVFNNAYSGQITQPLTPEAPAAEQPLATSAALPVPSAPAEAVIPAPVAPLASPTATPASVLKRGTRLPVKTLKVTPKPALLTRDYGPIADALSDRPENAALAERLATMSDAQLKKLAAVWHPSFEPDVTKTPNQVMGLIDRVLGTKNKAASLKKGTIAKAQKEIVTTSVTEAAPAPVAEPVPEAKTEVKTEEVKPEIVFLKKGARSKPKPRPSSTVKNAEGVAVPANKTVASSETNAELNEAIETWNDPKDTEDLEAAARYVISTAFFGDSNDKTRGRTDRALATLDSMLLDAKRKGGDTSVALDRAIISEAHANEDAPKRKEFQALVQKRGLRDRIRVKNDPGSEVLQFASDTEALTAVIDDMLTNRVEMQELGYRTRKALEAKKIYNSLRKAKLDPVIHGVKASELFKNDRLDIQKDTETGVFRLAVGMDPARDVMTASDAPSGMFSRIDGVPLTQKFAPADVLLRVKALTDRFKFKPKIAVFRNTAEMKTKNPALYKRAADARPQGDFATTNAAGYSFSDQVIIFSDFVRDSQHLAKTVAHETLGHFGLRAFMSKAAFTEGLESVYNSDSRLRQVIDTVVDTTGMNRHEAIEEYLADYAAVIDNSMLANIWNLLKNALNKLGIRFEDDHARLLVNQARRYIRNGGTGQGSYFSAASLYDAMERMQQEAGTGRFSVDPLDGEHISSRAIAAQALSSAAGRMNGLFGIAEYLKKYGPKESFGASSNSVKDVLGKIVGAVETLDFRAARSEGLSEVYKLFESQHNLSRQLLTQFQALTSFTHKANWWVANKDAPTEADKQEAGELLGYAALMRLGKVDVKMMDSYGDLFTTDEYGKIIENTDAIKKIMKDGFVTAQQFRDGLEWTNSLGHKVKYAPREIDENSKYWKIYKEQREAVNAAALAVLRANYNALSLQNLTTFDSAMEMRGADGARFTSEDLSTLREISVRFYNMYLEGMETKNAQVVLDRDNVAKAEDFLYQVMRVMDEEHGGLKLKDWLEGSKDTDDFKSEEFKKVIAGLNGLAKVKLAERDRNLLRQVIANVVISKVDALNAEYYTKRTILSSYAPLKRDGAFQIRLKAVDAKGNPVELHSSYQGVMPYYREDTERAAIDIRRELDKLFGGKKYKVKDALGADIEVRFVAEHGKAKQTPDLGDVMDYANFVYILDRQGISITPAERERLVKGLTAQGSMARANLQRTGNPGWRANMVRNISEHLETAAHVAAKRTYRNQMDTIIDNDRKWLGDREKLERLKRAYRAKGISATQRDYLKREYDAYAAKYAEMASSSEGSSVEIEVNGKIKAIPTRNRGEDYREEAKRLLRWQAQVLDITDSTEDILSTNIGARLKTITVLAQLGMSVATAFVNVGSLVTHSTTYMSFYNPRNGFGMGFGMAKSSTALMRALGELKNNSFSDPVFIRKLLDENRYGEYGLEKHEAEFLLDQTTNGTTQAAQFNALIGSARGKTQGNRINDAIQKWMYMFSYTEQLNRRVTLMAAYRLELARIKASSGVSDAVARKQAGEMAHKAVITSQGEYSMFNRPELARGNFGQYIFMYKMFTAITVQMMRSLPPAGRVTFLAMMIAASGIKGVPFAEDIMDLVDTLAQMFGIKMTSIEKEVYQLFDALAPGYAPYFMRGALDQLTGSTVSSKVGMGDIIPLSGALKYGADPWTEIKQFAGPVFGATLGLAGWAQLMGKYGAESVGIKSDATSFNDILRNSPLAVVRSIGDSMAYMETGSITNIRGQVVSRDAGVSTYVARLLGFYPAESTRQNDIIRISKMGGEYAKAIKAEMVNAYVQAGIRGDKAAMTRITKQVNEWNVNARGTGLEVKDFQNAVKKSLTEAKREAVLRFRRSVSKQMRPQVDELLRLQGVNPND